MLRWLSVLMALAVGCGDDRPATNNGSSGVGAPTSGVGAAAEGDQGGPCYGNNTCNGDLTCSGGFCQGAQGTGDTPGMDVMGPAGPRAACSACSPEQVCVAGDCLDVPAQCPCPLETYCDLATNACKAGCTSDSMCDVTRICFDEVRECRDGCRDDSGCADGSICEQMSCVTGCRTDEACPAGTACVNSTCVEGCRSDADCGQLAGSTCVNNQCDCGTMTACSTVCVDISQDLSNCGGCGITCGPGAACTAGVCFCGGDPADTTTDIRNCGGCGISCGPGTESTCQPGGCVNGQAPTGGVAYAACSVAEDCLGDGCAGIHLSSMPFRGGCVSPCSTAADCPPTPGGFAVPECNINGCFLNCHPMYAVPGVPGCPDGLVCFVFTDTISICITPE